MSGKGDEPAQAATPKVTGGQVPVQPSVADHPSARTTHPLPKCSEPGCCGGRKDLTPHPTPSRRAGLYLSQARCTMVEVACTGGSFPTSSRTVAGFVLSGAGPDRGKKVASVTLGGSGGGGNPSGEARSGGVLVRGAVRGVGV